MQLARLTSVYTLNPLEITATVGILSKSSIRIPLNRICNYEVRRTFLERIVGLGDVMIDTPGTSGHELVMAELDKSVIDAMLTQLNTLLAQQKIAEAGDNTELREAREDALENTETISS